MCTYLFLYYLFNFIYSLYIYFYIYVCKTNWTIPTGKTGPVQNDLFVNPVYSETPIGQKQTYMRATKITIV